METQSELHLYPLKKVHGRCKRQGMTDPEVYFLQYEDAPHFATENASNKRTENETRRI